MKNENSGVMWLVGVGFVVVLVGLFWAASSINANSNAVAGEIDATIDARLASVENQVSAGISGLQAVPLPNGVSDVCTNTDGCDGWWDVYSGLRSPLANRVLTELTEDGKKDLFRQMENAGIDIDDDSDISSAWVEDKGEMLTDQDPRFGVDEDKTAVGAIKVGVDYENDDGNDVTDYFLVEFTVDELENGMGDADVTINNFEEVRKRFVLPHR